MHSIMGYGSIPETRPFHVEYRYIMTLVKNNRFIMNHLFLILTTVQISVIKLMTRDIYRSFNI